MSRADHPVHVLVGPVQVRDFVCGVLALAGLTPVVLRSAYEYLARSQDNPPGCLVLGVELPDMCGLELQRRIAASGTTLVFVAERVDVQVPVSAIKAGAVDFLILPVEPFELLCAVRTAIDLTSQRREQRARIDELRSRYGGLTPREREALPLITAGLLNKQTASIMGISPITLQIHRGRIMRKMAARSFAELVRIADRLGASAEGAG